MAIIPSAHLASSAAGLASSVAGLASSFLASSAGFAGAASSFLATFSEDFIAALSFLHDLPPNSFAKNPFFSPSGFFSFLANRPFLAFFSSFGQQASMDQWRMMSFAVYQVKSSIRNTPPHLQSAPHLQSPPSVLHLQPASAGAAAAAAAGASAGLSASAIFFLRVLFF